MDQRAFFLDGTRCTGCKTCVFACKDKNGLGVGLAYREVYEVTGGQTVKDESGLCTTTCFVYHVSTGCNHCDHPACVDVCPTGAMHKEADTGLVLVDSDTCVGCGRCRMACPYHAPKVDRPKGCSVKCDGCIDLLAQGEKPACVMACPTRALDFGSVGDMSRRGRRGDIAPLPDPIHTGPNIYILPCVDARPTGDADGKVANPLEVM